jgi:protein-L-isoaspartate O-methyltransferase
MSAEESSSDASDAVGWYDDHAEPIAERHESLAPEKVNAWLETLLPSQPALALDVGAGSGRDAAWLLSLGHQVIAVEPSEQNLELHIFVRHFAEVFCQPRLPITPSLL